MRINLGLEKLISGGTQVGEMKIVLADEQVKLVGEAKKKKDSVEKLESRAWHPIRTKARDVEARGEWKTDGR